MRGRDVVTPYVIGSGPVGNPPATRNVDPQLRDHQTAFAFMKGAGALLSGVSQIGNPTAGATGPSWVAAEPSPAATGSTETPPSSTSDGGCGCGT